MEKDISITSNTMDGFWHFKRHFGAVMKMSDSMSADVYSDLTNGLVLKNYPKMTPDTLKSIHWIRSYVDVFFHVSYSV